MNGTHPLGTIARMWRYPVKSLLAEPLERLEVAPDGIVGDRRRALFVASPDQPRSGREYRGKENALLHTVATVEGAQQLAGARNVVVKERADGPFFDAEPLSIVLDCWVRALEDSVGMPLDPQRFRPNFYVAAAAEFDGAEASLVGRSIEIGAVRLEVVSTIKRCVTPSYDVATGEAAPVVLRELVRQRDNVMGVYCRTSVPGAVAIGDLVSLV